MDSKVISTDLQTKSFFSQRKKEKEKFNFGITSTYITMLSLICILLLYYVWILNANATKWYNIRELEIEKRELSIEKERLDIKIAELESIKNIIWEDDAQNMEKAENAEYLVIREWVQYVYNNKR